MPTDPVSEFVHLAREIRLLPDDEYDRITTLPDRVDLHDLCEQLIARGSLTRFQAERILTGRGYSLAFAGHVLLDERPGSIDAVEYRALEPSTRTPVRLVRFPGEVGNLTRLRSSAGVVHPKLSAPVSVGEFGGEVFATYGDVDGADLATLIADMGPMPALLAAEYVRQVATGVEAAHASGVVHAHLRPDRLFVGPLVQASKPKPDGTPRYRPSPTASVIASDFGFPFPAETVATPPDDVCQLGEVLHFLLSGILPEHSGVSITRPDCPETLTDLLKAMLAADPAERPTAPEVVRRLTSLLDLTTTSSDSPTVGSEPVSEKEEDVTLAETEQVELVNDAPQVAVANGWATHPAVSNAPSPAAYTPPAWTPSFEPPPDDTPYIPRRVATKRSTGGSRRMLWLMAAAFLAINLLAFLLWLLIAMNPFATKGKSSRSQTVCVS